MPIWRTYRRIVRRVSDTFWLFRELVRYGRNCAVIAPGELRQLFRDELLAVLRTNTLVAVCHALHSDPRGF